MKAIIDVKVKDLERAIEFYTEKLGLSCRHKDKEWAAIKVGDAEIHLYLHAGITSGLEFYVDDLDNEVKKLKKKGVDFFSNKKMVNFISVDKNQITTFPWGRNAFFKDSEGNQLALVKDFE
ncbi:MAG: VOC family protein [Nanoarchaeota archaeon]|nr:VOC family protein [Nanoarchaeota archaeon]